MKAIILLIMCAVAQTPGRMDRLIAEAKASGTREIHEDAPLINYNQQNTLQDLIADTHPLLMTVLAVTATPDADRDTLFTRYLLKMEQNIRGVSLTPANDTSIFKDLPSLDANTVYILARQLGGTITEQGVKITMEPPGKLLTKAVDTCSSCLPRQTAKRRYYPMEAPWLFLTAENSRR